ncbi:hypothetical protein [Bradyrhizobium sp. 2TAF24]|uniref:hypothetical protein n=1 Tax=Bradyrhizobium sp. 2TAF24 TaxID=3233011 RepID=UPI003F921125
MRTPVLLVTISLAAAIVLATLAIATTTRGDNAAFESSAGPLTVGTVAGGPVHP